MTSNQRQTYSCGEPAALRPHGPHMTMTI